MSALSSPTPFGNSTMVSPRLVDTNGYVNDNPFARITAAAQAAKDHDPSIPAVPLNPPSDAFTPTANTPPNSTDVSTASPITSSAITAPPKGNGLVNFIKSPVGIGLVGVGLVGVGLVGYNAIFNNEIKQLQGHVRHLTGEKASNIDHLNQHLPHFANALNKLTYGGRDHDSKTWGHISSAIADVHKVHGDKLPVAHLLLDNVHAHPSKLESHGLASMQSASSKVVSHFADAKHPINNATNHALFNKAVDWVLHGKTDLSTLTKEEAEQILKAHTNVKHENAPVSDAITRVQAHLENLNAKAGNKTKASASGNFFQRGWKSFFNRSKKDGEAINQNINRFSDFKKHYGGLSVPSKILIAGTVIGLSVFSGSVFGLTALSYSPAGLAPALPIIDAAGKFGLGLASIFGSITSGVSGLFTNFPSGVKIGFPKFDWSIIEKWPSIKFLP